MAAKTQRVDVEDSFKQNFGGKSDIEKQAFQWQGRAAYKAAIQGAACRMQAGNHRRIGCAASMRC
jgi:hypothetical protein